MFALLDDQERLRGAYTRDDGRLYEIAGQRARRLRPPDPADPRLQPPAPRGITISEILGALAQVAAASNIAAADRAKLDALLSTLDQAETPESN